MSTPKNTSITSSKLSINPTTPSPKQNNTKESVFTFSDEIPQEPIIDYQEIILRKVEPLLIDRFPVDLLWLMCKDSFNNEEKPSAEFLSTIETFQRDDVLDYDEFNETYEFQNASLLSSTQSDSLQWKEYYFYWVRSFVSLNEKVTSPDLKEALKHFERFKLHYAQLITHLLTPSLLSKHLTAEEQIQLFQLLGGNVSRISQIVLEPSLAIRLTHQIVHMNEPQLIDYSTITPNQFNSKLFQVNVSFVAALLDYAVILRLTSSTITTTLNILYYATFLSSLINPQTFQSYQLHTECLLFIAMIQHEQFDRPHTSNTTNTTTNNTSTSTKTANQAATNALAENIEYLYRNVITRCNNAPYSLHLNTYLLTLLIRAQISLAMLLISQNKYEESQLLLSTSLTLSKKIFQSDTHLLTAKIHFVSGNLSREMGQYRNAMDSYTLALNSYELTLNTITSTLHISTDHEKSRITVTPSQSNTSLASAWIGKSLISLAILADDEEEIEEALTNYMKGLAIFNEIFPLISSSTKTSSTSPSKFAVGAHLGSADAYMNVGALLCAQKEYMKALEAYEHAYRIYDAYFFNHPSHPDVSAARKALVTIRSLIQGGGGDQEMKDDQEEREEEDNSVDNDYFASLSSSVHYKGAVLSDDYFNRHVHVSFPHGMSFLVVQAELMEAYEYYGDAEVAYRDALALCRDVEKREIEQQLKDEAEAEALIAAEAAQKEEEERKQREEQEEKERKKIERKKKKKKEEEEKKQQDENENHTSERDDGDGEEGENVDEDEDEKEEEDKEDENKEEEEEEDEKDNKADQPEEKKYRPTSASRYIAYILYRLGGTLEEIKRSQEESEEISTTVTTPTNNSQLSTQTILSIYEECVAINRFIYGEECPQVSDCLIRLGLLYCYDSSITDYTLSESLLDEALTIATIISHHQTDSASVPSSALAPPLPSTPTSPHPSSSPRVSDDRPHPHPISSSTRPPQQQQQNELIQYGQYEVFYHLARLQSILLNSSEVLQLCSEYVNGYNQHYNYLPTIHTSHILNTIQPSVTLTLPLIAESFHIHCNIANTLNNYGNILQELGYYSDSIFYYTTALVIYSNIYEPIYNSSTPLTTRIITTSLKLSSNQAGLISTETLIPHINLARGYNNLGSVYDDLNQFNTAKQFYEHSLTILAEIYGIESNIQIAIVSINLGSLFVSEGLLNDAKPLYEIALAIYRDKYSMNHPTIKEILILIEKTERKQNLCIIQ